MQNNIFKGLGIALPTPFSPTNIIDYQSLEALLNYTADIDYYVINGTTAESPVLNQTEKQSLLDFISVHNQPKKPLVFGIGGNHTAQVLESYKQFNLNNVDAILSVVPAYSKPTQTGLIKHFETLANHFPKPLILYNVPSRTSKNLSPESVLTLAQHPNIIGIKQASANLEEAMQISSAKPADFLLISGDDNLTLPMIALGGVGVISVIGNAFPQEFKKMVWAGLRNEWVLARQILFQIMPLIELIFRENNPAGIKALLKIKQIIATDQVRLPLVSVSQNLFKALEKASRRLKKLISKHILIIITVSLRVLKPIIFQVLCVSDDLKNAMSYPTPATTKLLLLSLLITLCCRAKSNWRILFFTRRWT